VNEKLIDGVTLVSDRAACTAPWYAAAVWRATWARATPLQFVSFGTAVQELEPQNGVGRKP
jgi:hypothetical protein